MARSLMMHGEAAAPAVTPRFAIAAKGFRPFFLLAGAFAVAIVPLWLMVLGGLTSVTAYLDPVAWHVHEMVYGFAVAVIAGFLLTAVENWTKRVTAVGAPLLGLAGLWIAGRAAMLFAQHLPRGVPAAVDLAFLPLLALAIARPLVATGNRRNFVMLGVLGALFAANVCIHLEALGVLPIGAARHGYLAAVDVVVLVILVLSARVFPMFTKNATGVASIRSFPALDGAAAIGMALVALADALLDRPVVAGVIAGAVGVLTILRALHWGARHSVREPLLWILHAGNAWLTVGLSMRLMAVLGVPSATSLATHALTVGAIGSLTLGMMARVSLGHSGRALRAPRSMAWAFAAITGAAVIRVFAPLFTTRGYLATLVAAGALWTFAFAAFVVVYFPILTTPRVDGKAG